MRMRLDRFEFEEGIAGVERAMEFFLDVREAREKRSGPIELHENQYNQKEFSQQYKLILNQLSLMEQQALANILKTVRHKLESKSCSYDEVLLELHVLAENALRQGNQHLINQIHNITKLVTVLNSGVPADKPAQPKNRQTRKLKNSRSIQTFSSNKEIQAARKARANKLNKSNRYSNIKVLDEYSPDRSDLPLSQSILEFNKSEQRPLQERTLEESRSFMRRLAERVRLNNELSAQQFQQLKLSYQKIQSFLKSCSVEKNSTVQSRLFFQETDSVKRLSQRVASLEKHVAQGRFDFQAVRQSASQKAEFQQKNKGLEEIQRRIRMLKQQRRQMRIY